MHDPAQGANRFPNRGLGPAVREHSTQPEGSDYPVKTSSARQQTFHGQRARFHFMDARDVAAMTETALTSMEHRLKTEFKADMADLKADLKHDIELLSVKVDVNQRTTARQMDEGFRQIIEHIDRR